MSRADTLSQILRYTEPDHPDHATLTRSLTIAEGILNVVNEAVRVHDNQEKLVMLSDNLEFAGVNAVRPRPLRLPTVTDSVIHSVSS